MNLTNDAGKQIMDFISSDENLLKRIEQNQLIELVVAIITKMPEATQEILVLRHWEGKSYSEISDIVQKPVGSVSSIIMRARSTILRELEKGGAYERWK